MSKGKSDDVARLIEQFQLEPHPEGGYFRETYRSNIVFETSVGKRNSSTAIYFLLFKYNFSAFHRIASDEVWHFYAGDPISVFVIHQNGTLEEMRLGNDFSEGQVPQCVVPAGAWFASKVANGGLYGLVGCTVSPGFDFADFEMGDRIPLMKEFPQHTEIISELTRT